MTDSSHLHALAYKSEKLASRRLARRTGISLGDALRATFEQVAGPGGLAQLVSQRQALHAAQEERAKTRADASARALAVRQQRHDGPVTPWRAWFDGSAHPNPGRCGIGGLLTGPADQRVEISRPAGYGNSSEAEYHALIAVLEAAVHAGASGLTIYGDSQVVINDVGAEAKNQAPALRELRTAAVTLISQLHDVALRWIPRHKNPEADALSQRAIAAREGDSPAGGHVIHIAIINQCVRDTSL